MVAAAKVVSKPPIVWAFSPSLSMGTIPGLRPIIVNLGHLLVVDLDFDLDVDLDVDARCALARVEEARAREPDQFPPSIFRRLWKMCRIGPHPNRRPRPGPRLRPGPGSGGFSRSADFQSTRNLPASAGSGSASGKNYAALVSQSVPTFPLQRRKVLHVL